MSTRSEVFIAAAAFWHFLSSGKSKKVVFTATPPATEPAKTMVVTISVHIVEHRAAVLGEREHRAGIQLDQEIDHIGISEASEPAHVILARCHQFLSEQQGAIMIRFCRSAAMASGVILSLLEPTFAIPIINASGLVTARNTDAGANLVHWYNYRAVGCNLRVPCPLRHVHNRLDVFYGEYWRPGRRPMVSCNLRVPCPDGYL
jgi:hypothetical protein